MLLAGKAELLKLQQPSRRPAIKLLLVDSAPSSPPSEREVGLFCAEDLDLCSQDSSDTSGGASAQSDDDVKSFSDLSVLSDPSVHFDERFQAVSDDAEMDLEWILKGSKTYAFKPDPFSEEEDNLQESAVLTAAAGLGAACEESQLRQAAAETGNDDKSASAATSSDPNTVEQPDARAVVLDGIETSGSGALAKHDTDDAGPAMAEPKSKNTKGKSDSAVAARPGAEAKILSRKLKNTSSDRSSVTAKPGKRESKSAKQGTQARADSKPKSSRKKSSRNGPSAHKARMATKALQVLNEDLTVTPCVHGVCHLVEPGAGVNPYYSVEHQPVKLETHIRSYEIDVDAVPVAAVKRVLQLLPVGFGCKGGVARQLLKIGPAELPLDHPLVAAEIESESKSESDVDLVVLAGNDADAGDARIRAWAEQCDGTLRLPMDIFESCPESEHMLFDPADVEVLTQVELERDYWTTRDVTMNECLVLRSAPDKVRLYYTTAALQDAQAGKIRAATRSLHNNYCFMWMCDPQTGQPILAPEILARCLIRFLKGHGQSIDVDDATLHYYRRSGGLAPRFVFQILKSFLNPVEAEGGSSQHRATAAARWLRKRELLNPYSKVEDVVREAESQLTMLVRTSSTGAQMSIEKRQLWSEKKRAQVLAQRERDLLAAPVLGFVAADHTADVVFDEGHGLVL